jgi:hypothetical protein
MEEQFRKRTGLTEQRLAWANGRFDLSSFYSKITLIGTSNLTDINCPPRSFPNLKLSLICLWLQPLVSLMVVQILGGASPLRESNGWTGERDNRIYRASCLRPWSLLCERGYESDNEH